jgi:hypothetical protein
MRVLLIKEYMGRERLKPWPLSTRPGKIISLNCKFRVHKVRSSHQLLFATDPEYLVLQGPI